MGAGAGQSVSLPSNSVFAAARPDGSALVVTADGTLYRADEHGAARLQKLPASAIEAFASDAADAGIAVMQTRLQRSESTFFRIDLKTLTTRERFAVPKPLRAIAPAPDGTFWAVDNAAHIVRLDKALRTVASAAACRTARHLAVSSDAFFLDSSSDAICRIARANGTLSLFHTRALHLRALLLLGDRVVTGDGPTGRIELFRAKGERQNFQAPPNARIVNGAALDGSAYFALAATTQPQILQFRDGAMKQIDVPVAPGYLSGANGCLWIVAFTTDRAVRLCGL